MAEVAERDEGRHRNTEEQLDARIGDLVDRIQPWLVRYGLMPGLTEAELAAKARVICTFATLCAPAQATTRGHELAARLTGIFFFLDDVETSTLRDTIAEMLPVLRGAAATEDASRPAAALFEYLDEMETLGETRWFKAQFALFLEALIEEADRLARGPLSMDDYLAIRHRVIFVDEYIWTWLISEQREMDEEAVSQTALLRRLASQVVYLINDVGSVERERAAGKIDPNLVFLLEDAEDLDEQQAVQELVSRHDATVAEYGLERARLLETSNTGAVRAMVSVLDETLHGNLATTRRLVESRYPGATQALRHLAPYPTCL